MSTYDYTFKIICMGDAGVGKTCLTLQFTDKRFQFDHVVTLDVEYGSKLVQINNKHIRTVIWDTGGHETYRSITRSYYRGAAGALLVYDTTSRETFNHLTYWIEEVRNHANPNMPITLLGNKSDLSRRRVVTKEEGEIFAKKHGLVFMEVSAKTRDNVDEAFRSVVEGVLQNIHKGLVKVSNDASSAVKLGSKSEQNYGPISSKKGSCCSW